MPQSKLNQHHWVVVPAYNEARYLDRVLTKIRHYTPNIVLVSDGSTDATVEIAKRHTPHVLEHVVNLGKGAALRTGSDYAFELQQAEAVYFLDSDDQHDPDELLIFEQQLIAGNDMVFGVRGLTKDMPMIKRAGNVLISLLVYLFFGQYFSDILSGYKAFTSRAYDVIRWDTPDYAVELEIAVRVARSQLRRNGVIIKTIYHDHDRGMTLLDALHFFTLLINWRISL